LAGQTFDNLIICHIFKINLGWIVGAGKYFENLPVTRGLEIKPGCSWASGCTRVVNARARNSRDILQLLRNPLKRTEIAACMGGRMYIYTSECADGNSRNDEKFLPSYTVFSSSLR